MAGGCCWRERIGQYNLEAGGGERGLGEGGRDAVTLSHPRASGGRCVTGTKVSYRVAKHAVRAEAGQVEAAHLVVTKCSKFANLVAMNPHELVEHTTHFVRHCDERNC